MGGLAQRLGGPMLARSGYRRNVLCPRTPASVRRCTSRGVRYRSRALMPALHECVELALQLFESLDALTDRRAEEPDRLVDK
jgi:hypothetical protein